MGGLMGFLKFTMETGEEFQDGWLPTLDTSLRVNERNLVLYKFYQKEVSSNTVIQRCSAMAENSKIQILSNDMVRRMLNTSENLRDEVRCSVVDSYAQMLINSGYSPQTTRKVIMNGLKNYENKKKASFRKGGRPLHVPEADSRAKRQWKKLVGKSEWFKGGKRKDREDEDESQRNISNF